MNEKEDIGERPSRSIHDISLRIQEFVEKPLNVSDADEYGSSTMIALRTDWVEILAQRFVSDPNILRIEIEVSIPHVTISGEHASRAERMTLDMIAHMNYLLKLLDAGFTLQVVGEECLWIAAVQVTGIPAPDVIQKLVPP